MKKLILLGFASFSVVLLSACHEDERHHEHRHGHYGVSTTTTEETTVRHAAPRASSTVVETY